MLQSFLAIPKIPDLWRRVKYTLMMIAVFRIAAAVPSPFLDLAALKDTMSGAFDSRGLLQFVNLFSGGAFERMTVLALGIMPYITASIIIQLLGFVVPSIERMMKEGEAGKRRINDWTRYGTIGICAVQSIGISFWLLHPGGGQPPLTTIPDHPVLFTLFIMLALTTGSTFLMWMGEKISENGIGNGISIIITLGIVASYPMSFALMFEQWRNDQMAFGWIVVILVVTLATMLLIILIQQGQRKIPIQHAKRMMGRRMVQAQTSYLPLRINTAGVIPVIFSGSILSFPALFFGFFQGDGTGGGVFLWLSNLFSPYSSANVYNAFGGWDPGGAMLVFKSFNMYTLLYAVLTIFFCFFYTAITFNPVDVADNLKRSGAFIPGRRPGKPTSDFIDFVLVRITVVGSIFLTAVALTPQVLTASYEIPFMIANVAGGTGLIIVVGVMLDTMRQVESHLVQHRYDGFVRRGRLKGRF